MRHVLIVTLAFMLHSCADFQQGRRLAELDRLSQELVALQERIRELKRTDNTELRNHSEEISHYVHANIDTLDQATAFDLDEFTRASRTITEFREALDELDGLFKMEKIQLDQLKHDVKHAYGRRASYDKNISFEEKQLTKLAEELNELEETYREQVVIHRKLYPHLKERLLNFKLLSAE